MGSAISQMVENDAALVTFCNSLPTTYMYICASVGRP
jgi:hypothetical protein